MGVSAEGLELRIQKLLAAAARKGNALDYDEMMQILGDEELDAEQYEKVLEALEEKQVTLVEAPEEGENLPSGWPMEMRTPSGSWQRPTCGWWSAWPSGTWAGACSCWT